MLTKNQLHGSFTPVNSVLLVFGVISASTLAWRVKAGSKGGVRLEEDDEEGVGGARSGRANGRSEREEAIREEEED